MVSPARTASPDAAVKGGMEAPAAKVAPEGHATINSASAELDATFRKAGCYELKTIVRIRYTCVLNFRLDLL